MRRQHTRHICTGIRSTHIPISRAKLYATPMPKRANPNHPTRERLIDTVLELTGSRPIEKITSDQVLERSGVSKGSLYHHFEDFQDLIGAAAVKLYASGVNDSIEQLEHLFERCDSVESFYAALDSVTQATQDPNRHPARMQRITLISLASRTEKLRAVLAAEQQRLSDTLSALIRRAQLNGWVDRKLDAQAVAVFIQAYTTGRVLDDISLSPVDPASWTALIKHMIRLLLPPRKA